MTKDIAVGVIGLGEVGRHQAEGVLRANGAKLVAVADFNADLVADWTGRTDAKGYASAEELLADPFIEAAVICVPHKFHEELCRQALDAGKHVLVEKPVTVTSQQADGLIALAASKGLQFGASHNQLFYPAHEWLIDAIRDGRISRPSLLRLRLAIGGKLGGWRADPDLTGGGLLFDAGFHRFYMAHALMGPVTAVTARLDTDNPRGQGEDSGIVILEFEAGGMAVIDAGYHAPNGCFDDQIEVVTPSALYRVTGLEAHFEKFTAEPELLRWSDGVWSAVKLPQVEWPDTIALSVGNFIAALRGEAPMRAEGFIARDIVRLVEAAYRSSAEGRRIML